MFCKGSFTCDWCRKRITGPVFQLRGKKRRLHYCSLTHRHASFRNADKTEDQQKNFDDLCAPGWWRRCKERFRWFWNKGEVL